jgi:hypothetical protein
MRQEGYGAGSRRGGYFGNGRQPGHEPEQRRRQHQYSSPVQPKQSWRSNLSWSGRRHQRRRDGRRFCRHQQQHDATGRHQRHYPRRRCHRLHAERHRRRCFQRPFGHQRGNAWHLAIAGRLHQVSSAVCRRCKERMRSRCKRIACRSCNRPCMPRSFRCTAHESPCGPTTCHCMPSASRCPHDVSTGSGPAATCAKQAARPGAFPHCRLLVVPACCLTHSRSRMMTTRSPPPYLMQ